VIAIYLIVHGGYSLPLLLCLSLDPPVFVARQAQAGQKRLPDAHELAMISDDASFPLRLWNCFDLFELGPAQFEERSGFVIVEVVKDVVQHHDVLLPSFHESLFRPFSIATNVY
jgi:hypothetical protein